jgi:hypothetical protein
MKWAVTIFTHKLHFIENYGIRTVTPFESRVCFE